MRPILSRFMPKFFKSGWKTPRWLILLSSALFLLIIAFLMTPPQIPSYADLSVGEKVWEDIRSNFGFTVVDESTTERRRQDAEKLALPVYDFDSAMSGKLEQRVTGIFGMWRQYLREARIQAGLDDQIGPPTWEEYELVIQNPEKTPEVESGYSEFITQTGLKISTGTFQMLKSFNFSVEIEEAVRWIIERVCQYSIINDRNNLLDDSFAGLIKKDLVSGEEKKLYNLDLVLSIEDSKREIDILSSRYFPDNQILQDISAELTRQLIRPNLTLNMLETQNRRRSARESVKPVYFRVSTGEIIARSGDTITPEIKLKIDQLNRLGREQRRSLLFFGNLVLSGLLFLLVVVHIQRFDPELLRDRNRLVLLGLISLIQVILIKSFMKLTAFIPEMMSRSPFNLSDPYLYAIPFAVGSMMVALLVHARLAILISFIFGIVASISSGWNFWIGLYAMTSSCASVFAVTQYKQRTMVIQAGFFVSIANLILVLTLWSLKGDPGSLPIVFSGLMAVVNGVLVAVIVTVLLPVLEWLFQIPTDIRLLELSNFNQPLLRRLALEAPGTHHHSLIVGDLAEVAAEAIGANALLARVGAYYHDIGKISKPHYFIENIRGKNPHEDLTPSMSAMILRNHLKYGIDLARKSGLGQDIINIIAQHHGNSIMSYFYEKARAKGNADVQAIWEDDFRYPGPRPRSKEAAIVLIADSVEAAARSIKTPSASILKNLVNRITLSKFQDHQFDDCDLTFRELTVIAEKLYQCLLRNYHSRIDYPGFSFNVPADTSEPGTDGTVTEEPLSRESTTE
ncbi:HDIG domain-containing protein [bacterium]|nr:HDIG domain-containing protein [candidate division CSSED10-310 bacterium]